MMSPGNSRHNLLKPSAFVGVAGISKPNLHLEQTWMNAIKS